MQTAGMPRSRVPMPRRDEVGLFTLRLPGAYFVRPISPQAKKVETRILIRASYGGDLRTGVHGMHGAPSFSYTHESVGV